MTGIMMYVNSTTAVIPDQPYIQWTVVRAIPATGFFGGADYLKHVIVRNAEDLNPCEYYRWWDSNLSTLSNNASRVITTTQSLQLDYPTSSGTDILSLTEGDTFGTDTNASWRDMLNFSIYISDIDKLDTEFGYFFFGNSDEGKQYRWNINTFYDAEVLDTGWNHLFLKFYAADDFIYETSNDPDAIDPGVVSATEFKTLGMLYRGKGQPFTINLDGFKILRNTFQDNSYLDLGLYLHGSESLTTSLGKLDITKGTIEFFLRPDYDPSGVDTFGTFKQRNLFCLTSTANDMLGAMIFGEEIGFYFGNLTDTPRVFWIPIDGFWTADETVHFAFVFSNDGTGMGNSDTLRLYVNNILIDFVTTPWNVYDNRRFRFNLGGKAPFTINAENPAPGSSIDGVISDLKIHNYCKVDFTDSLVGTNSDVVEMVRPSQLIELSKDNLTFYNVDSGELPFVFEEVPDNNEVIVYVRNNIPKGLTGDEKRTAGIIASWDVGV